MIFPSPIKALAKTVTERREEMITKEKPSVFQLVKTPAAEIPAVKGAEAVYSALALYPDEDGFAASFVYDISRKASRASDIIRDLNMAQPSSDELYDFISERL